uniref:DUF2813 domain-containing protein n=1 Tax=Desulfobacca acetoxidans TaxID=60893 RepID=A0A7V4GA25_9BACT
MLLRKVTIENFRGLKRIEVDLDETTVLIGENNSGKTAFLHAIHYCLNRVKIRRHSNFDEYDYHFTSDRADPLTAGSIIITLEFIEKQPDEWDAELVRALGEAVVLRDDDRREVRLVVKSYYDHAQGDFVQDWQFLDSTGNPLTGRASQPQVLATLQQLRPMFYLSALRDAAREFGRTSPFWGPFLRSTTIPEGLKQELETALGGINEKIVQAHESFDHVREHLTKVQKIIPLGREDLVSIDALPVRVFDMLSRTQVSLACNSGAKIPIFRHGEGTQSLSVLFLFDAFLKAQLGSAYDRLTEPIIALEEPEAHLHPCAIRSLWQVMSSLRGQKIIASHSGDLLAEVPLQSIRRFSRENGEIKAFRVAEGLLNDEELRKFNYHIRQTRGELLFARCWLLGEGETEMCIFQELGRLLELDMDRYGVRFVAYSQGDIEVFLKVADALGISWHCLFDNNSEGQKYKTKVLPYLRGRTQDNHISTIPEANIDLFLCKNGFTHIYKNYITPNIHSRITVNRNDPQYCDQLYAAINNLRRFSKPRAAWEVVEDIRHRGPEAIPPFLAAVLHRAMFLAGWSNYD